MTKYILVLSCRDDYGIVAAISTFLTEQKSFITELSQYGDPSTQQFFLRTEFETQPTMTVETLSSQFQPIADIYGMTFQFRAKDTRFKAMILVSKQGHCLNDLLHRVQMGSLNMDVQCIVSNHSTLEHMAKWHSIPFYHLPIDQNKEEQEQQILDIAEKESIDLFILARYMQILSKDLCQSLKGKAINIHHSFLPSFKGAKPYHQAYERGVKIIGATAHYVTEHLDEGPIIVQEIDPVKHSHLPKDLIQIGYDNENRTLARAVKLHTEMRIMVDGHKTVIFD
ncbi:MAG: formyltetrahydrofolate deformylase [Simkaniaceae bacterium]|nr:formyltetrahydrofolate deformylase [Simkaniaceae bacterium]MCF7852691.1 formyltetrahydrofolate deformylase [Simkaniaceae bacterium]